VGCVILDKESNGIIEFALGESAYESYLSEYKKVKGKNNNKSMLIKNGAIPAVTFDNFNSIEYFLDEDDLNINVDYYNSISKSDIEVLSSEIQVKTLSDPIKEFKILYEVQDISNSSPYVACGPMSATNIAYYWGNHGYTNLTSGKSLRVIYNLFYYYMGSFPVGGGQVATSPFGPYSQGFEDYFDHFGYTADVAGNLFPATSSYTTYIKNPIQHERPGVVLFNSDSKYGQHYTVLVGYGEDYYSNRYYIYNPLRDNPQIWRNYDTDITGTSDVI
jgi:hypothetical protein